MDFTALPLSDRLQIAALLFPNGTQWEQSVNMTVIEYNSRPASERVTYKGTRLVKIGGDWRRVILKKGTS